MSKQKDKTKETDSVILLLVEGETEVYFYKLLIKNIRDINNAPFSCEIEYKNIKGIGKYTNDALRRFDDVKRKYPHRHIEVILCYDTDVFELSKKPPVDMKALAKVLFGAGAHEIIHVKAKSSIEDWFILDWYGVLKHLRLNKRTKRPAGKGKQVLKNAFLKANRVYVKGGKNEGFIDSLNIETIRREICKNIQPLCHRLGIDCNDICKEMKT
ncbi:MAG: hypothetical protein WDA00_04750 [Eubacteriales bacterium]